MTGKTPNIGAAAIALDDMLRRLDPQSARELHDALAAGNVAWHDQLLAAAATARDGLQAVAASGVIGSAHVQYLPAEGVPDWVRLQMLEAIVRFCAHRADTCMHAPHPSRPEPLFAAAWRPGLITCGQCGHLFEIGDPVADRTCDRCGHADDVVYPVMTQMPPLTFMYGLCRGCHAELEGRRLARPRIDS